MAFGRGAKLEVVVAGDTRQLDRSLTRAEARLKKFGKNVNTLGGAAGSRSAGMLGGMLTKGNVALAGGGALVLGLRGVTKAAMEAEVVLGQTAVAVRNAGIDWGASASRIDAAATRISRASSFDDEDVLKSFQVFVRGQRDVGKALELSALSADVARGRYTDLESATSLVNKAAMGQVGALRRAGIQIDKNATSTQALDALTKAYAGSSKKYADSAAGGIDRLRVAWENLQESSGAGESVSELAGGLASVVEWTDRGLKKTQAWNAAMWNLVESVTHLPVGVDVSSPMTTSIGGRREEGDRGRSAKVKQPVLVTQLSNRLIAEAQRAELSGSQSALRGVLMKEKAFLQGALGQKGMKPGQVVALQADLLSVVSSIQAIDDQIAQDAQDKVDAAQRAKDAMAESKRRAVEALKAQAQTFRDQASDIKSAALASFDTRTSKIDNARALESAKESLRIARLIGAPEGLKLAQRGVFDANRAIQRQALEDKAFRVSEGPQGPVNRLAVGSMVFNITTSDPKQAAAEVVAILNKRSKSTAGQSRGRMPQTHP